MTHCGANSLSLTLVKKKNRNKKLQGFGDIQTWETASKALQDLERGLLLDSFPPVKAEGPDNPVLILFQLKFLAGVDPNNGHFLQGTNLILLFWNSLGAQTCVGGVVSPDHLCALERAPRFMGAHTWEMLGPATHDLGNLDSSPAKQRNER